MGLRLIVLVTNLVKRFAHLASLDTIPIEVDNCLLHMLIQSLSMGKH